MEKFNPTMLFLAGLLVGVLAIGWLQEWRIGQRIVVAADARYGALASDAVTLGQAFRIAQPDARERALAGAQAVHEQMKRGVK